MTTTNDGHNGQLYSFKDLDLDGIDLDLEGLDLAELENLDVDAELAKFEAQERERIGLGGQKPVEHWVDVAAHPTFTAEERQQMTILSGGLSIAQDYLVQGALQGVGYKFIALDTPDNDSFRVGKEFGNRGQCNPTYFTVGNLVKHLVHLRNTGMSTDEIIRNHVFITAGACGPCRFGMYVTEYRKALRDAGFEGFRVLLFEQTGGIEAEDGKESQGLDLEAKFFIGLAKGAIIGDVLNLLFHRIKPYEVVEGAADEAMETAKKTLYDSFVNKTNLFVALFKAQRAFAKVEVDRTKVKPMVDVIGEFWAMTTEGEGNYFMHRYLEQEGAEIEVQILTTWILFLLWESKRDIERRLTLRGVDGGVYGLSEVSEPFQKYLKLRVADLAARGLFQVLAHSAGLFGFKLTNIDELAQITADFYNTELRGGKSYLEVGKLIFNAANRKSNMTLSIKPFGCMPSSGVSDGVQTTITELYPGLIFLPIETSGDGAVNVYSRVQMMLFKAKQAAERDVEDALHEYGMTMDEVKAFCERFPILNHPLFRPPHRRPTTAANMVELVGTLKHPVKAAKIAWKRLKERRNAVLYKTQPHKFNTAKPADSASGEANAGAVRASVANDKTLPLVN
ncbi:MAG: 2-hydroxyglutaryl-CoA dehydratase [Myxococcales bacterium]|nr:2-hydroxyglutaryl-CoA dehydratase [Myxococcales bacterium]